MYVGIFSGTSATKAVIVNIDGKIVSYRSSLRNQLQSFI